VEQVRAAAARGSAEPAAAVRDMIAQLDALDTRMSERDTLLSGVGAGGGLISPPPPGRGEA
jgi:hypothetical protein